MSIKFRNNNYEIKQQIPDGGLKELPAGIHGNAETWYKWVLDTEDAHVLKKMLKLKKYKAIEVKKERWALKITIVKNDSCVLHDVDEKINEGCQLEYTKIVLMNEAWYSFAAEWFGSQFFPLNKLKTTGLPDLSGLISEQPASYSKFLNNQLIDKRPDRL